MDLETLNELDALNTEIAVGIRKNYNKELDILDFYPELKLEPPYTGTGFKLINPIKPYQLFPFFKTVLVDVFPLPDEKSFIYHYGLDLQELIDLERKNKVALRLPLKYKSYHNLKDDYLDPLLSRRPPSAVSRDSNYSYLINDKFLDYLEKDDFFEGKQFDFGNNLTMEMGMVDPIAIAAYDIMNGSGTNFLKLDEKIAIDALKRNCQRLALLGYTDVNKFLKKFLELGNGRLDYAFAYSAAYTSFLTDPTFNSLNGINLVNNNIRELMNDLSIRIDNKTIFKNIDVNLIPQYDLGKMLTDEIVTSTPLNLEQSDNFNYSGAIEALEYLENAVNQKDFEDITDRVYELKSEIYVANEIVEDMQKNAENIPKNISRIGYSIGVLGLFGNYVNDPYAKILDVAAIVMGGLGESGKLKPVIEGALKFNKDSHVLYLYNNYENYELKEYPYDEKVLRSQKSFINPFIDNYKYYDALYKKIPILRVLIDVDTRLILGDGFKLEYKGKLPNGKLIEEIQSQIEKDLPFELFRIVHKHLLLYGVAYLINSNNTFKVINPKFVKPIYEEKELVYYEIVDANGKIKEIETENVYSIDPPEMLSIVESYILLFDEMYPKLTKKDKRPALLRDVFSAKMDIARKQYKNDFEGTKKILDEILPIAIKLKDVVNSTITLMTLGDLHAEHKHYEEALDYYFRAQKCLDGKAFSSYLQKIDRDLLQQISTVFTLLENSLN